MGAGVEVVQLSPKDFKGKVDPDWCPGCGDFGVLRSLQKALADLGLRPHEVLTVSGIGCSSNLPGYVNTYGMHTLHGRSLAVASGVYLFVVRWESPTSPVLEMRKGVLLR